MTEIKSETLSILLAHSQPEFLAKAAQRFDALRDFKVEVETARLGIGIVEKIYSHAYDLVFLDIDLPALDVPGLLQRLVKISPPLPLALLTDSHLVDPAIEATKRVVLDIILNKDFLVLDLPRLLRRLLETFSLRRDNAEFLQINQMKDDFLATISHELRTPLTLIMGMSAVMVSGQMGPLGEKQHENLKKILSQSENLVRLVNQLLEFRSLSQTPAHQERELCSLKDLLEHPLENLRPLFNEKGVTLDLQHAREPLYVKAHQDYMEKTLGHIVSNALKFTPRGGAVRVATRLTDPENVQIIVNDTGRGIPSDALPYVFQKFFHADASLTRTYGGMGLGLAYCKDVVEGHGGRIWVESPGEGRGTTLTVVLPLSQVPPPDPAGPDGKKIILWIDDNPSMLELAEYSFLSFPHNMQLVTAQGGQAGLEKIRHQHLDLIILDIMMSDMDGMELLDEIRRSPRTADVPVLVVTGYPGAARLAIERGARDYCKKPFHLPDLFEKIEKLLSLPHFSLAKAKVI